MVETNKQKKTRPKGYKAYKAELFLFSIKEKKIKECSVSLNFSRRYPEKPKEIKALMVTAWN